MPKKSSLGFSPVKLVLYSSWGISLLAIILPGKGIHSLQESGWISITYIPIMVRADRLGIYPSIESIVSLILLIVAVFTLNFSSSLKRVINLS